MMGRIGFTLLLAASVLLIWTAPAARAQCSGCQVTAGSWDPYDFLDADLSVSPPASGQPVSTGAAAASSSLYRSGQFPSDLLLKSPKSVSTSDLILDVSDGKRDWYPRAAVGLPYTGLMRGSGLRSYSEMAAALSEIGLSNNDSVVVASEDPAQAALMVWALKYLGTVDASLLDGGYEAWRAAGLPRDTALASRKAGDFSPEPNYDLLATSLPAGATLVDARPFSNASQGRLAGAVNIDAREIVRQGRIKDGLELERVFSRLDRDRDVVVSSPDLTQAAIVWYGLELMGFQASLMEWERAKEAPKAQTGVFSLG